MLKRAGPIIILFFICLFFSFHSIAQAVYQLYRRVIDKNTREPLKNVSVYIKENKSGGITNDSSYFNITVRIPKFTMVISSVGYVNVTKHVDLSIDDKPFIVELEKRGNA